MIAEPPDVLHGQRLDLVLVTVEQLLSRKPGRDRLPTGFADPLDVLGTADSPVPLRIAQVEADPAVNPWLVRVAVLRGEPGVVVGLANFHDRPDAEGMVELGYSVLEPFRHRGFGTELARIMWTYASSRADVRILRASVRPNNAQSLRIVRSAGLVHVGEQHDPIDGTEWVFELDSATYHAGVVAGVRQYRPADRSAVLALWQQCGLVRSWNDPRRDIDRKTADSGWGLLVAEQGGRIVATAMVGYDGHRGSLNYLAVAPSARRHGLGKNLVRYAEGQLRQRGCPKVNLAVRAGNDSAIDFYRSLGYDVEGTDRALVLARRLISDEPNACP